MGLLDLFRRKPKPARLDHSARLELDFSVGHDFVRIPSLDFFGQYKQSYNGRYLVAWQDADYQGRKDGVYRGGCRESGYGRVLLFEGESLLFHVDMRRPNDGAVGNNGFVAINDWGFSNDFEPVFFLLGRDGSKLIEHRTTDGLLDCGISVEGDSAWCTSSRSELIVFLTSIPRPVVSIPGRDCPENLAVDGDTLVVRLHGFDRRYTMTGNLINPEETQKAERTYLLEHGTGYQLLSLGEEILKEKGGAESLTEEDITELRKLFAGAAKKDISLYFKAKAHRHMGEIAEDQGDEIEALKQFTLALEYDPKVGCKKALARIEKAMKKGG